MREKNKFKDFFRMIYSSNKIGVAIARPDGRIQHASDTFKKFFNNKNSKIIGEKLYHLFPDENNNEHLYKVNNSNENEIEYISKINIDEYENKYYEVKLIYKKISNKASRLIIVVSEISELIKSKESLEVRINQLKEAERLTHVGHWEWDLKNNSLYWSDELYRMFGLEPGQIEPSYNFLIDTLHPEDREELKVKVKNALDGFGDYRIESRIILGSGKIRHLQTSGMVTFNKENSPIKMMGASVDITESKNKEIEIVELNKNLKQRIIERQIILENISEGILFINSEGIIIFTNEVSRNIIGLDSSQKVSIKNIRDIGLQNIDILKCLDGKSYKNKRISFIKNDRRFQYLVSGKPIYDLENQIIGALEVMTDIGEIKTKASAVSGTGKITFNEIIGASKELSEAIVKSQLISATDHIVSIYGESGTGKELFASAIHYESHREGPFVPVNCASLPENLLESELFGYEKGSFTGAIREGKAGLFEYANNGTVFLDEIGDMPLSIQAKLLRVIQEGKIRRIGSSKEIEINSRIITATNRNLRNMVENGEFREDLYYRINVFPINIPPLRERKSDIDELVDHFVFIKSKNIDNNIRSISERASDKLRHHRWPGNVRELRNVIDRSAILCKGDFLDVDDIVLDNSNISYLNPKDIDFKFRTNIETLRDLVEEFEKKVLKEKIKEAKSIRKMSKDLGLSHTAMIRKIKKYNLKV